MTTTALVPNTEPSWCPGRARLCDDLVATIRAFAVREDAVHVRDRSRGNCGALAVRFAAFCEARGLSAAIGHWDEREGGCVLRSHASTLVTVDGVCWSVDWTAGQFFWAEDRGVDRACDWPRIADVDCCDDCCLPVGGSGEWEFAGVWDGDVAEIAGVSRDDLPAG